MVEMLRTERILSKSGPSEDRLGGKGGAVGSFAEDDEELGVGALRDENDVEEAIVVINPMRVRRDLIRPPQKNAESKFARPVET